MISAFLVDNREAIEGENSLTIDLVCLWQPSLGGTVIGPQKTGPQRSESWYEWGIQDLFGSGNCCAIFTMPYDFHYVMQAGPQIFD